MHSTLSQPAISLDLVDGVLFDFNGTLSNDEPILRELFIELAAKYFDVTLTAEAYHAELAGRNDREILGGIQAMAKPGVCSTSIPEFLEIIDAEYAVRIRKEQTISTSCIELVRELSARSIKMAVVTGASRKQVIPALERAGILPLFETVVTDEDVAVGKPDPEGFHMAAHRLGLEDPRRIAVFEDSIPGLQAAKAAGMIPICVSGTHSRKELEQHADIIVAELSVECLQLKLG
ncbi:hypothetical protein AUR04nite_07100 [Glutamicibacter uratoxydans]|uniref:Haloacid dehalogenase n=1 Tax=Glutamicibacter uratoxydans TaxID=43667 RepID=A0A4Y4DP90_GLUUR|nr:HAD family phosphatase [Glutamicibacter uratoxydans]GED05178.1 hypothetical protein AUR04nite_07100 [Glutamicibacter uratoxydans]